MLPAPLETPPAADQLEVSLFGPGYGESCVVHLGGGRWLIVDSCKANVDQPPAPLEYLATLGVDVSTDVVAVVATHWHDDHVRGISETWAAAQAASFHCSQVMSGNEFKALTQRPLVPSRFSSGVSELQRVGEDARIRRASGGPAIGHVQAAKRIWQDPSSAVSEVWALSPSDEDIARSLEHLSTTLTSDGARRVPSMPPNDASVVLYLRSEVGDILLGADLEHASGTRARGWHAVLDDSGRPKFRAAIYKVAHHGARSAYCPEVWQHLLEAQAIALVSPFARGSVVLPSETDVDTLRAHTSAGHVTSTRRLPKPRYERAVERTIGEATRSFASMGFELGHLQVRSEESVLVVRGSAQAAGL